jgi:hypothetical protein
VVATEDGSTRVETFMATGIFGLRVVIPGEGLVIANVGREVRQLTIDLETGEVVGFELLFDAGHSPEEFDEAAAVAAVCAALSG